MHTARDRRSFLLFIGAAIRAAFRHNWIPYVASVAWLVALCAGWWWTTDYQFAREQLPPGLQPIQWPAGSKLTRAPRGHTLTLFLHPKCPCSRASIAELERLFDDLQQRGIALPTAYIIATRPEFDSDDWLQTDTVQRAANLSGARVVPDRGGAEAARFGAVTSGTIMLFDATGKRVYGGGITLARGMEGANAGRDAILCLLEGGATAAPNVPAFGCRLCLPRPASQTQKAANADSGRDDARSPSAGSQKSTLSMGQL